MVARIVPESMLAVTGLPPAFRAVSAWIAASVLFLLAFALFAGPLSAAPHFESAPAAATPPAQQTLLLEKGKKESKRSRKDTESDNWWVYFAGKDTLNTQPALAPLALLKRDVRGIALTAADYPVAPNYLAAVQQTGAKLVFSSRWLNAAKVQATAEQVAALRSLPPVRMVRPQAVAAQPLDPSSGSTTQVSAQNAARLAPSPSAPAAPRATQAAKQGAATRTSQLDYGLPETEIRQLNLPYLHDLGYRGEGVFLAMFDDGFFGVDTRPEFARLRNENRIVAAYDFVADTAFPYQGGDHGTNCLSQIVAFDTSTFIGSCDRVRVALARTENGPIESRTEEENWLAAAEWADSLGVDIISSSLIYNYGFTDGSPDYAVEDLDGQTALVTQAAQFAASRGMLVVNSAGNEGNTARWRGKISPPADADSILGVGGVNSAGMRVSFSGMGPTADGRIKPDVMAMGFQPYIISGSNGPTRGSGTSFAAPLIAGLSACLWSSDTTRSMWDIRQAVLNAGDNAATPDTLYGYGLPNAEVAYNYLQTLSRTPAQQRPWRLLNNWVTGDFLHLQGPADGRHSPTCTLLTAQGKALATDMTLTAQEGYKLLLPENLAAGLYLLRLQYAGQGYSYRFYRAPR